MKLHIKDCFSYNDFFLYEHILVSPKKKSTLKCFLYTCRYVLSSLKNSILEKSFDLLTAKNTKNGVLFFCPTLNNQRALQGIINYFGKEKYIVLNDYLNTNNFPSKKVRLKSLKYCIGIFFELLKYRGDSRWIYSNVLDSLFLCGGYYEAMSEYLDIIQPKCVLMSNDHVFYSRVLLDLCKSKGIKTIYVQHASVAPYYPPLNFTYSILDGEESFLKYTKLNRPWESTVIVLGACRFDYMHTALKNNKEKKYIGLALNPIDSINEIENLCKSILALSPDNYIYIRTHPAMILSPMNIDNNRVVYTSAYDETPIDFFNKIKFLIANDSSIHLDAAMARVPSVMYCMSDKGFSDQYNYVDQGLVKYIPTKDELLDKIKNEHFELTHRNVVQYFNRAYDRKYEGSCSKMVYNFIKKNFLLEDFKSLEVPIVQNP